MFELSAVVITTVTVLDAVTVIELVMCTVDVASRELAVWNVLVLARWQRRERVHTDTTAVSWRATIFTAYSFPTGTEETIPRRYASRMKRNEDMIWKIFGPWK